MNMQSPDDSVRKLEVVVFSDEADRKAELRSDCWTASMWWPVRRFVPVARLSGRTDVRVHQFESKKSQNHGVWSGLEGDLVSEDRQGDASSETSQPDESLVLDSEEEEEELSMDGKEPSTTRLPSLGWPIYSLLAEMDDKDDLGRLFLMVSGREKLTHYDRNEKESDGSLRRDWCVLVRGRSRKPSIKSTLPSAAPWWPIVPNSSMRLPSFPTSGKPSACQREIVYEKPIMKTESGFGITLRQIQERTDRMEALPYSATRESSQDELVSFGPIIVSGYPNCAAGNAMERKAEVLTGDVLLEVSGPFQNPFGLMCHRSVARLEDWPSARCVGRT